MLFLLELRKTCKRSAVCTETSRKTKRKTERLLGECLGWERASAKILRLALVSSSQGSKGSLVVRAVSKRGSGKNGVRERGGMRCSPCYRWNFETQGVPPSHVFLFPLSILFPRDPVSRSYPFFISIYWLTFWQLYFRAHILRIWARYLCPDNWSCSVNHRHTHPQTQTLWSPGAMLLPGCTHAHS